MNEEKLFLWMLGISTFLRFFLAKIVPITGDEAYFIIWAKHLNYGYYEHPPMIGWVMWLFSFFGNDIFIFRIFPLIVIPSIAIIMVKVLSDIDKNKAFLCGSVFLLSPVSILNVLSVNDVPLILFTFLSGIFFYRAIKTERIFDAMICGFFAGCAFLSKYFAALLVFSLIVFCLFSRNRRVWKLALLSILFSIPLVMVNIIWNYNNCWLNIMFNLFFRNKDASLKFYSVIIFLLEQIFLMTPYLAIVFFKKKFMFFERRKIDLFWFLFITPLIFFFFISFVKNVGLHWMASFYPFFFLLLIYLQPNILIRALKHNLYLSVFIVVSVLVILLVPVETYKSLKKYPQTVMFLKGKELSEQINLNLDGKIPASTGYTESSIFSYYCKKDFVVFGSESRSGRFYDYITDFNLFDGKDFLIVSLDNKDTEKFSKYFKSITVKTIKINGAEFYLISGNGFIFNYYRQLYLTKIYNLYYHPPRWLPVKRNFFKERYLPEKVVF